MVRHHLTYANVMATIAVFIALGGGAYAAVKLPRNSVGSKQIKRSAVTGTKVKDRSLLAKDFRAGQLPVGARGATGAQGPTGATGPQGLQGPPGTPAPAAADEVTVTTFQKSTSTQIFSGVSVINLSGAPGSFIQNTGETVLLSARYTVQRTGASCDPGKRLLAVVGLDDSAAEASETSTGNETVVLDTLSLPTPATTNPAPIIFAASHDCGGGTTFYIDDVRVTATKLR